MVSAAKRCEGIGKRMGKTVLITGASSGFGAQAARLFAENGDRLILVARRRERLNQLKRKLSGADVLTLQLDVCDRAEVESVLGALPVEFQAVDVLLNSAGLALGLDFAHTADLDDWDTMVKTNINGLTYCTHSILPGMVERNCGHIINIGSTAGTWPYPGGNVYGATKAFVKQFSYNLRADLLGTPIRVTCIEPGLAQTEFSNVRFKGDVDKSSAVYEGTQPLTPENIADVIFWVTQQPPHVNVNSIEIMPVCQGHGALNVHRERALA